MRLFIKLYPVLQMLPVVLKSSGQTFDHGVCNNISGQNELRSAKVDRTPLTPNCRPFG